MYQFLLHFHHTADASTNRLHAWLFPSATQNISSVTDLATTTSKRNNNKDTTTKRVEATCMTPLSDIYNVYSRYGFHPPSCPVLTFEEFLDLLRNTSGSSADPVEPVWNQPTTGLVLRHDIPLDLLRSTTTTASSTATAITLPLDSPKSAKFETAPPPSSLVADATSNILVQASFRYSPSEWIDAEPYLATPESQATNPTPGQAPAAPTPVTKGKHFKEHDIVWRSVGLNFARWVKAEKAKRTAKVEVAVANALEVERERERKRQRLEHRESNVQRQMQTGGLVHQGVGQGGQGHGQGMAQASVFVRPAQPKTPEERRRIIMTAWYVAPPPSPTPHICRPNPVDRA